MPTSKPRITITISEQQHQVLARMASLGGGSMSAIVVDLLDTLVPVLERVVVAMQAAHDAPKELHAGLKASLEKAERDMLPHLEAAMGQLDMLETLVPQAPAQSAPAAPGARKSARPPSTNRGVRIPKKSSNSKAVSPMKTTKNTRESRK